LGARIMELERQVGALNLKVADLMPPTLEQEAEAAEMVEQDDPISDYHIVNGADGYPVWVKNNDKDDDGNEAERVGIESY
jgi:hypothetical protein